MLFRVLIVCALLVSGCQKKLSPEENSHFMAQAVVNVINQGDVYAPRFMPEVKRFHKKLSDTETLTFFAGVGPGACNPVAIVNGEGYIQKFALTNAKCNFSGSVAIPNKENLKKLFETYKKFGMQDLYSRSPVLNNYMKDSMKILQEMLPSITSAMMAQKLETDYMKQLEIQNKAYEDLGQMIVGYVDYLDVEHEFHRLMREKALNNSDLDVLKALEEKFKAKVGEK